MVETSPAPSLRTGEAVPRVALYLMDKQRANRTRWALGIASSFIGLGACEVNRGGLNERRGTKLSSTTVRFAVQISWRRYAKRIGAALSARRQRVIDFAVG